MILGGVASVCCQSPVSARITKLGRELAMQLEASPRQLIERAACAPVERQEATRFAGGRARNLVPLDHSRLCAPPACEIRDGGADHAAATDHDALARAHESQAPERASAGFRKRTQRLAIMPSPNS
jgi:hypothetical protein